MDVLLSKLGANAEGTLLAMLEQSRDCIKLITPDGRLEFMNPNGREAMAIEDFNKVAGEEWWSLWPEPMQAPVRKAVEGAARGHRSRFEGYCPTAKGEPRWWDVSVTPIRGASGEVEHILSTSRDITLRMNERMNDQMLREMAQNAADRSDMVAREMRHRLKNLLAVVASVSRLLARGSDSVEEFVGRLEKRLGALAQAQNILVQHDMAPAHVDEVIERIIAASAAGDSIEIKSIPHLEIGEQGVETLALLLGELQTNALKYGALSSPGGSVVLTVNASQLLLSLHWHEDCGREVVPSENQGAGRILLQRLGSHLGKQAAFNWHRTGVAVDIHVPLV